MWTLVTVVCLAASVLSEPRLKRQLPCTNNWVPANNPCLGNNQQVYFPHPKDASKFLQCDVQGRMYVIQCPSGMLYTQATTSCQPSSPIVTPPKTNTASKFCNAQLMATGQIYFAVPNNNKQFVECTPGGGATILTCPALLVWNQIRRSCVYATNQGVIPATPKPINIHTGPGSVIGTGSGTGTGVFTNPCVSTSAVAGKLYYAHPDIHKFIQCDTNGDAFVVTCPGGLIWNTVLETCYSPFSNTMTG